MKKVLFFGFLMILVTCIFAVGEFTDVFSEKNRKSSFEEKKVFDEKRNFRSFDKFAFFGKDDEVRAAFENKDYEAYISALEKRWNNFREELTLEKFNDLAEKKFERKKGFFDSERVFGMKNNAFSKEQREVVQKALENKDYFAWKDAIADCDKGKQKEIITEENFEKFAEMQIALRNKDFETAKIISEDLGLEKNQFMHSGRGRIKIK
jgi:hypothetical protein